MDISQQLGAMKELSFALECFGVTDVGLVRDKNEDVFAINEKERLFLLADGMGGHKAGDVAAKAAVNALMAILKESLQTDEKASDPAYLMKKMESAFREVNHIVYRLAEQDHFLKGMGTTLVCLHIMEEVAVFGHIGDSRIYRFGNNQLDLLSQDHSLLRELMEMGQLTEEQAKSFMYKNILTRAVGTETSVEPTVQSTPVRPHDLFLLFSDGLTDLVSFQELETMCRHYATDLKQLAKALLKLAKQRGAQDNITQLFVRCKK